jgi:hypothetical protein
MIAGVLIMALSEENRLAVGGQGSWTPALTSRVFGFRDSLLPSLIWRRDDGATVAVRFVGAFGADQQDWRSARA